jgi:hypothetical protein
MTDPEYYFDDHNPSDYRLFGIHYLLTPTGSRPPVRTRLKLRAGPYSLWTLPDAGGVLHAGTIVGHVSANRTDIGTRALPVLHSSLAQHGQYEEVRFGPSGSGGGGRSGSGGGGRSSPSSTVPPPEGSAGTVATQVDRLSSGRAAATVVMHRSGVIVLSASFDPGWTATVDGRSQPTEMVAPALVGTTVRVGTHHVVFLFGGFRGYPLLFAIGAATLLALLGVTGRRRVWRIEMSR